MILDDSVAADLAALVRAAAEDPATDAYFGEGLRLVADRLDPGTISARRPVPWHGIVFALAWVFWIWLFLMFPIGIVWFNVAGPGSGPFIGAACAAVLICAITSSFGSFCLSDDMTTKDVQ